MIRQTARGITISSNEAEIVYESVDPMLGKLVRITTTLLHKFRIRNNTTLP